LTAHVNVAGPLIETNMKSDPNKKSAGSNSTLLNIIFFVIFILAYILLRKLLYSFFPQNDTEIALIFIIVILIISILVAKWKRNN